ncbi:lipopolysaccharide ABC transporter substrate-binding protein LptA [Candidatus Profftia sp. (ex Adelges kitamiensis)]|uniref:lipopolysaccharide ABC transporter substrate-binding protein LptA n=1 Tax=Candidatus Profftia sp. (ex Adelges kitamiensis) TaxID=2864218 RepID=UPI001CE301E2|nr:lipopolysaccharide ABC transporter substrate-binding protein LptA [Candidatus Profftia sp. (ex Adelges kitamiensis)]
MICKQKQKIFRLIVIGITILISFSALSLQGDTDQPIHINSSQQFLDVQGNYVTFTGDVVVKQGTIKINADKIIVIRPNNIHGKEIVEGYGSPVIFYHIQDNGKTLYCYGYKLRYELEKDLVSLIGHAFLKQIDSSIKGDKITYLVKKQRIEAFSNKGSCVTTTLLPTQLQDTKFNASSTNKNK